MTWTPWGNSQSSKKVVSIMTGERIPGLMRYDTAGHGGYHLSPKANRRLHAGVRNESGWYEEDIEWAKLPPYFPNAFSVRACEEARQILRDYFPDAAEIVEGRKIGPEESLVRAEAVFYAEHTNAWLVRGAWGDWHEKVPTGFVGVRATVGGARRQYAGDPSPVEKYFLIPAEEYSNKVNSRFSFVVDPSRHQEIESLV